MAGLFCCSFDVETTLANLLLGKFSAQTGSTVSFVAGNTGQAIRHTVAAFTQWHLTKTLAANYSTLYCKFHWRADDVTDEQGIISFFDSNTCQVEIAVNSGNLKAYRGGRTGTLLGTSSGVTMVANTWYAIQVSVVIDGSAGSVVLAINNTNVLNLTSQNTKQSSNAYTQTLSLGNRDGTGHGSTQHFDYDDLILCDNSGSVNNTVPAYNAVVGSKLPNAAGSNSQFTPDSGSNYARVNESDPDGDTSYVQDTTQNDRDTYKFPAASGVNTINFVQVSSYAKNSGSGNGTRHHQNTILSGSTYKDGTEQVPTSSYACYSDILETDPNTSAAWGGFAFDAAEFGVKLAA
jgi:hypothetical protein